MCTWWKTNGAWFVILAAIPSPAQTFTTLASFNWTDGAHPWSMSLVQGINGNLFGTTYNGGMRNANCDTDYPGCGGIFEITPAGALTVVHKFDGTDGNSPMAGLLVATSGNLYAVTSSGGGGTDNCGTIYTVTPGTTLHVFQGTDGCAPNQLIEGADGNFYGTTIAGGLIFRWAPSSKSPRQAILQPCTTSAGPTAPIPRPRCWKPRTGTFTVQPSKAE